MRKYTTQYRIAGNLYQLEAFAETVEFRDDENTTRAVFKVYDEKSSSFQIVAAVEFHTLVKLESEDL